MSSFEKKIIECRSEPLRAKNISTLQVNMGFKCNSGACAHCHVNAGPKRAEEMDRKTVDSVLSLIRENGIGTIDITGGAPELNPHFGYFVRKAKDVSKRVMVRTNLTVFFEKGMEYLPIFYSENGIELVASFPHCSEPLVDEIRGRGTFRKSLKAMEILNRMGYGTSGGIKALHLVHNPAGATFPDSQRRLESRMKEELGSIGLYFDRLYAFANMPIGRFKDYLRRTGQFDSYMEKARQAFNPSGIEGLMCRHGLSVGWDGGFYDCDFNLACSLPVYGTPSMARSDYEALSRRRIRTAEHCFICTAGQGFT